MQNFGDGGQLPRFPAVFQNLSRMTVILSNKYSLKEVESGARSDPGQKKHSKIPDIDQRPITFTWYQRWRAYRAANTID